MKKFITAFIKYPFYANLIVVFLIVAGFIGLMNMNKSFFPERSNRDIVVSVAYPGASPKEMEEGITTRVEEAVRRMTLMPAQRLGLNNRGLIREGVKADLTVFNLGELRDNATFDDPHRYPSGIPYVVVNGEVTIDQGEHTGAHAGEVQRRR